MRVTRRDAGELAKPVRTPEGFLRVEGVLARACILEYQNADGSTRHELVTPEVLFDPKSLASFSVLALTNEHPDGLIDPKTVGAVQCGTVGEPRPHGSDLVSMLGVLRQDAVDAVEGGKAGLSCGYSCEVDDMPGTSSSLTCPQCGTSSYDGVQRDRRGNHVAIVTLPRAGSAARMRLDAAGNSYLTTDPIADSLPIAALQQNQSEPSTMPNMIHLDGIQIDAAAPDAQAVIARTIDAIKARNDAAVASEKARADAAVATLVDTTKRLDGIKAKGRKILSSVRSRLDAMMKRNVMCDECKGAKMIDGAKCPSCDGLGMHSARDAIQGMAPPPDGEPVTMDDDLAEMSEDMPVDDSMETPDGPGVDPAKQEKGKMDRAAARKAARSRRDAMLDRITTRRAVARAALLDAARPHVDASDLGKSDVEIQRAVLVKIAPHLDAANMDASQVPTFYAAEMKRIGSAPSAPLTQSFITPPAPARVDTAANARAEYLRQNPWARPAGSPQ